MRRTVLAFALLFVPTIAVAGDPFGQWSIKVRCSYGSGSYLFNIDENGQFKGSINGRITSGSISGASVQFTTSNFLNSVNFTGSISPDGNSMTGQYTQATWNQPCTWTASKIVAYRQEPRTSESEYRKDAAEAIQIAKEMAKRCTYADQMAAADQLQRAASAYRSIGDQRRLTQVNAAITKITKNGGTADQCRQNSTSSRNKVAAAPRSSNKKTSAAQCKKANDWALQLIRSHPDQTKFAKDSVEQLGCKPAFSAMPTSCKLKDQLRWQRQGFTEAQIAREKRRLKCSG